LSKLTKRLLYIIVSFALLVGMIPLAAMPASAASGDHLNMYLVDPITGATVDDDGYNVATSIVEIVAVDSEDYMISEGEIEGWAIQNVVPGSTDAVFMTPTIGENPVRVMGDWGEAIISCTLEDGDTLQIGKKWGKINGTEFLTYDYGYNGNGGEWVTAGPQSLPVTWDEGLKAWGATTEVTDSVTATFVNEFGQMDSHPVQGVILNWYLLHGTVAIPAPDEAQYLKEYMDYEWDAIFADFVDDSGYNFGTQIQTVTDEYGMSTVDIVADGEEAVTVVVIPEYPSPIQLDVVPEVTTINFWTREMEVVPQVRWAGEKIVLEKNFGTEFYPPNAESGFFLVNFALENQSPGILKAFDNTFLPAGGGNLSNSNQSVWTTVDENGLASVMLESADPGEIHVDTTLYWYEGFGSNDNSMEIDNQHAFTVYYLKLESLKLENVVGKRVGHNTGDWTPANPWDDTLGTLNVLEEEINVSQDTLLRARVKGWFEGSNRSVRPEVGQDIDNDGVADLTLPQGRWVLPDDWAKLAGPNWQSNRIHWDIMDNPFDAVISWDGPQGDYETTNGDTEQEVVGPFSPGIELMTPTGWEMQYDSPDPWRDFETVISNGVLEWWDAPMPPAKIVFEILDVTVMDGENEIGNSGFFKEAQKDDIYYLDIVGDDADDIYRVYTNPFYEQMIPAHQDIPAFINNGGYDWNSFDWENYGEYEFWTIINQPNLNAQVATADPAGHPTKVEVYSDNHGEAMVYLNGDWNLNLQGWGVNGAADVSPEAIVGSTTVQAMADYPYSRIHQAILSNTVTKTWIWGGLVLGTDQQGFLDGEHQDSSLIVNSTGLYTVTTPGGPNPPLDIGTSDKKMVWLWLTDRDGMQAGVLGAKVDWRITEGNGSVFISGANGQLSAYNDVTKNIFLQNGFLAGTAGMADPFSVGTVGTSVTRAPTNWEASLFNKYYPDLDASCFAVAGVEIQTSNAMLDVTVFMNITSPEYTEGVLTGGMLSRKANIDFATAYPLDDDILHGDANVDGSINMGDVTAVELGILGLQGRNINADANGDGKYNMADVIKIERTILGCED
jgi:hypothetical protein